MHIQFIQDLLSILNKKHLTAFQRFSLIRTFIKLKIKHKKGVQHNESLSIGMLEYSVYTDNYNDFFATFYEIFIKEEYLFDEYTDADIFIDAGANIGLATLYFKWLMPKVKIVGFEMDEETFGYYQKNVTSNNLSDVKIYNYAVGSTESSLATYGSRRATTLYKNMAENLPEKAEPRRRGVVQVKKLSSFLPQDSVSCLKMDIEGAEAEVLHELDASASLKLFKRMIFEFHLKEEKFSEIQTLLQNNGFLVSRGEMQNNGHFMVSAIRSS